MATSRKGTTYPKGYMEAGTLADAARALNAAGLVIGEKAFRTIMRTKCGAYKSRGGDTPDARAQAYAIVVEQNTKRTAATPTTDAK